MNRRFEQLAQLPGNGSFDSLETVEVLDERMVLEDFVADAPPITAEGAITKIRWVLYEIDLDLVYEKHGPCLHQVVAFLKDI